MATYTYSTNATDNNYKLTITSIANDTYDFQQFPLRFKLDTDNEHAIGAWGYTVWENGQAVGTEGCKQYGVYIRGNINITQPIVSIILRLNFSLYRYNTKAEVCAITSTTAPSTTAYTPYSPITRFNIAGYGADTHSSTIDVDVTKAGICPLGYICYGRGQVRTMHTVTSAEIIITTNDNPGTTSTYNVLMDLIPYKTPTYNSADTRVDNPYLQYHTETTNWALRKIGAHVEVESGTKNIIKEYGFASQVCWPTWQYNNLATILPINRITNISMIVETTESSENYYPITCYYGKLVSNNSCRLITSHSVQTTYTDYERYEITKPLETDLIPTDYTSRYGFGGSDGKNYNPYIDSIIFQITIINQFDINYYKGVNGTGTEITDIKQPNIDITLRNRLFNRIGYMQAGWSTSDGGAKVYDLGAVYSDNASIDLYPYWVVANTIRMVKNNTLETYLIYIVQNGQLIPYYTTIKNNNILERYI